MAENQECKSNFSIVRKICAVLNLGEQGKLDSFFGKVERQLTKEIKFIKNNMSSAELVWEHRFIEQQDELEDAKKALEDALMQVDVTKITTNEDQSKYVDVYLKNIDEAKKAVERLEKNFKKEADTHQERLEDWTKQIVSLKARLEAIVG